MLHKQPDTCVINKWQENFSRAPWHRAVTSNYYTRNDRRMRAQRVSEKLFISRNVRLNDPRICEQKRYSSLKRQQKAWVNWDKIIFKVLFILSALLNFFFIYPRHRDLLHSILRPQLVVNYNSIYYRRSKHLIASIYILKYKSLRGKLASSP